MDDLTSHYLASISDSLLPCPHCGERVRLVPSAHVIECAPCRLIVAVPDASPMELQQKWNTRVVRGVPLLFTRTAINEVAPVSCWVVIHGDYLYGPCERHEDLLESILSEWEEDIHLVGGAMDCSTPASCSCHERDNSYACEYCHARGFYGHMEQGLKGTARTALEAACRAMLGGLGACSREYYTQMLQQIAKSCDRHFDDCFRAEVREIVSTFPCPLD